MVQFLCFQFQFHLVSTVKKFVPQVSLGLFNKSLSLGISKRGWSEGECDRNTAMLTDLESKQ